jgi:hypothetical protein
LMVASAFIFGSRKSIKEMEMGTDGLDNN